MFRKSVNHAEFGKGEGLLAREKMDATLLRLQMLKSRVSELRSQCEDLRNLCLTDKFGALLCSECGKKIELGRQVSVKDSAGVTTRHYHEECFRTLLKIE